MSIMEINEKDYAHIKGWGIDADPENEPTYPIKKYTGDDHDRINWVRPALQPVNIEVLKSNERPNITAVFGTSAPPTGLSGSIRRFAFKYSENKYRHWLPLILADRVNEIEGIIDDIKQGSFPNIFDEKGWNAEWKYNKLQLLKRVAVAAVVTTVLVSFMKRKSK
jgi:hypothetical protein